MVATENRSRSNKSKTWHASLYNLWNTFRQKIFYLQELSLKYKKRKRIKEEQKKLDELNEMLDTLKKAVPSVWGDHERI